MEIFRTILIGLLLAGGIFFFLVGTVGLIRLPDVFTRMHATTKADTLGAGFIFLASILYRGFDAVSLKILVVLIFIWITNPTAAHIIAKAEFKKEGKSFEEISRKD